MGTKRQNVRGISAGQNIDLDGRAKLSSLGVAYYLVIFIHFSYYFKPHVGSQSHFDSRLFRSGLLFMSATVPTSAMQTYASTHLNFLSNAHKTKQKNHSQCNIRNGTKTKRKTKNIYMNSKGLTSVGLSGVDIVGGAYAVRVYMLG